MYVALKIHTTDMRYMRNAINHAIACPQKQTQYAWRRCPPEIPKVTGVSKQHIAFAPICCGAALFLYP